MDKPGLRLLGAGSADTILLVDTLHYVADRTAFAARSPCRASTTTSVCASPRKSASKKTPSFVMFATGRPPTATLLPGSATPQRLATRVFG